MDIKEILYVALATIVVMVVLQIVTFMVTRMIYPPEPKVVYRDVPQYVQAPIQQQQAPIQQQPLFSPPPPAPPMQQQNGPALTQPQQEIQLPEYEPRKPASTSVRMDLELPPGIQETRPPGT
jgi:hypothetical protein